eukprot:1370202-Rhodomonas_salina.2
MRGAARGGQSGRGTRASGERGGGGGEGGGESAAERGFKSRLTPSCPSSQSRSSKRWSSWERRFPDQRAMSAYERRRKLPDRERARRRACRVRRDVRGEQRSGCCSDPDVRARA